MLPEKLSELRKKKGLSQIELAEALNVSRQAVSKWETGAALPSVDNLLSLRELYNVSLDEMLDEREGPENTVAADAAIPAPVEAESRKTQASATVRRLRRALWAVSAVAVMASVAAIVSISMLIPTAGGDKREIDPVNVIEVTTPAYCVEGEPLEGESPYE